MTEILSKINKNKSAIANPLITYVVLFLMFIVFAIWVWIISCHDVFEEWDGVMQYFSGIYFWKEHVYTGWASHFWPPLQPLIISLGDPLAIGKGVAFFSGIACIYSVYKISEINGLSKKEAMLVVLMVISSSTFLLSFSVVENHAMETGFALIGLTFFLLADRDLKYVVLSAAFIALAGMTRYTSYIYALIFFLLFLSKRDKFSFSRAAVFSITFILISSFWWIPNYFMNGSPLSTWQYLNVGSSVHPDGKLQWWWSEQNNYNNLIEIFKDHPILFIVNFFKNIFEGLYITIKGVASNIVFSIILFSCFLSIALRRKIDFNNFLITNKASIISSFFYIILCSIAFVFHDALLPVIIIATTLIGIFLILSSQLGSVLVISVATINTIASFFAAINYIDYQKERGGQLTSLNMVTHTLTTDNASIISSIHPARAYYAKSGWIMFPLYGIESLCDVVVYDVSEKVYNYVPKNPVILEKEKIHLSHLVVGPKLKKLYPFIESEMKNGELYCNNFELTTIYNDNKNVSVFRVNRR